MDVNSFLRKIQLGMALTAPDDEDDTVEVHLTSREFAFFMYLVMCVQDSKSSPFDERFVAKVVQKFIKAGDDKIEDLENEMNDRGFGGLI